MSQESKGNLERRIEKMLAAIEPWRGPAEETPYFEIDETLLHLLTEQEQARLQAFVDQVNPKLKLVNGRADLSKLTEQELDEGSLWLKLGEAFEQEDVEAAARYRRYLNQDIGTLIAQFLSIDEMSIPGWDSATSTYPHAPKVQRDGVTYTLHRANFRSTKQSVKYALSQNRHAGEFDTMRMWVEAFPAQAAAS